jgi:hypothetical protein
MRHSVMKFIAVVIFLILALPSEANVLTRADAQMLHALRAKFYSANMEITQAMDQIRGQNPSLVSCLAFIHDSAGSAQDTAAAIDSLIALAAQMQDRTDEILVLYQLKIFLNVMIGEIPNHREIINRAMAQCSNFAIVTTKGQAMLNLFSELSDQVKSLARTIAPSIPSRQ